MADFEDPFGSSVALARWVAGILRAQGIDYISKWRMLEYWMQVELYRAVNDNKAGAWRHVGDHEQPYYTQTPRSDRKSNVKWVDLLLAQPDPKSSKKIVWVELKDVGRNEHTLKANSVGIGQDLAALYKLNRSDSKALWLDPQASRVDRGRVAEWKEYAAALDCDDHFIAQIVLVPRGLAERNAEMVVALWLRTFERRVQVSPQSHNISIERSDTDEFAIFALVSRLRTS
ncbi:MAG: hypothetical protein A3F90_19290 [Deltaproteobacteria bacterium RIFCSPLOWO2_12_FULL_60_19]|nr:MAG: hypothetical protein A3F90_19290 [Deltaproteobacteria bacterium RIFCSPLOWO2_12_FULL_60_19]